MGATYTRQSSATIVDGATIEASHFNAEFDQLLAAFAASSGHTHDGTANEGGPITKLLGNTLTFGAATAGTDITITFDGETSDGVLKWMEDEDYFEFSDDILVASTEKLQFRDTAIYINSSADGQLDLVADTEIQIAATTVDINGNVDISGTLTVGGALDFSDASITNVGSLALDSITSDGSTITLDSSGDIILDADGADITLKDGGTTFGSLTNSSGELVIKSGSTPTAAITLSGANTTIEGNLTVDGNFDVTGTLDFSESAITNVGSIQLDSIAGDADSNTSITFSGSDVITMATGGTSALTIDASQNVTIAGDLTVSGDDITMATNTAGNLLIADGTNFNSVAVGSLSEISTVANDDVFLAIDTSGGGLKKIARSAVVAGLATSSAISNVADDSTPQLGGDLDVNGNDIVSVSNGNINLLPNGSGKVIVDGNGSSGGISLTDGNIDIRTGTGAVSKVKFYCESSNAHAQTLQAAPHSASSSAVVVLPTASGTLVASGDTGTVTNTMLAGSIADSKLSTITTAGKVDIGALEIDGATDIGADLADADLIIVDDGGGGTERKSAMSRIPTYVFGKVSGDATVASNGALTIASDAVEQSMIADDAVGADQLAASAVVTASIVDDNVTQAKIADDAVGADQLAANAVVNASIASGAAIADTKLATISTAGKVALTALASSTTTVLLGIMIGNTTTSQITVTVSLASDTSNRAGANNEANQTVELVTNAPVPVGGTLELLAGNKVVMEATDALSLTSSAAADIILSVMEIT
jgi:hypothetical protein